MDRRLREGFQIRSREQLFYTLTEAAEIEHNLMCCYLYAAFSLKSTALDGLSADDDLLVSRWRRSIMSVAVEEMSHLALVANLMTALGGAPHFGRPNFPINAGYHPAGVQVKLAPFNLATLQHFIFLERPDGSAEPDGEGFAVQSDYVRALGAHNALMPSAQDYETVGDLYRAIANGIQSLAEQVGEAALFVGDPTAQVGEDLLALPGMMRITDVDSALRAIDTIVRQGEGASEDLDGSHFQRFVLIRTELQDRLAADPGFRPARPAAHNPVMRRPPDPVGKVFIESPAAAALVDLANALYGQMLRLMLQGFGRVGDPGEKRAFLDAGVDLMFALGPLAEHLTALPARDDVDCTAGMTFSTLRPLVGLPSGEGEHRVLAQRFDELLARARGLAVVTPAVRPIAESLSRTRDAFVGLSEAGGVESVAPHVELANVGETGGDAIEEVEGASLTLVFEGARCIHSRRCVTGAPHTFLANVSGAWLHPDATPAARLVEIAHACPSGAIRYRGKDGIPDERAPPVNLASLRENGPYAFAAKLLIDGQPAGFRATLCRCGASRNKPYCDGSHTGIGFTASGEPETRTTTPLSTRDGRLDVRPQRDGPLLVDGPLEILSGTGRVVARVTQARLCRCGGSSNKPFCDGTHARIGFRSQLEPTG